MNSDPLAALAADLCRIWKFGISPWYQSSVPLRLRASARPGTGNHPARSWTTYFVFDFALQVPPYTNTRCRARQLRKKIIKHLNDHNEKDSSPKAVHVRLKKKSKGPDVDIIDVFLTCLYDTYPPTILKDAQLCRRINKVFCRRVQYELQRSGRHPWIYVNDSPRTPPIGKLLPVQLGLPWHFSESTRFPPAKHGKHLHLTPSYAVLDAPTLRQMVLNVRHAVDKIYPILPREHAFVEISYMNNDYAGIRTIPKKELRGSLRSFRRQIIGRAQRSKQC